MLKKAVLLVCLTCFLYSSSAKKDIGVFKRVPRFHYPELFRDHVFDTLSEKGKEVFYAVNIQASCAAKRGQCIPRAQCVGREMLYLTRMCYKRDLVCCYDNTIRFPEVGDINYTTASTTTRPSTSPLTSKEETTMITEDKTTVTTAEEITATTESDTTITTESDTTITKSSTTTDSVTTTTVTN